MKTKKALWIAVLLMITLALPNYHVYGRQHIDKITFQPKNIYPTLVPTSISYIGSNPLFIIDKEYTLTASGETLTLGIPIDKVVPISATFFIIHSGNELYSYNPITGSLLLTATSVVKIATDGSGYATFRNGKIYIYNIKGGFVYTTNPPITDFSITGTSTYIIKMNQITKVENSKTTTQCISTIKPYALLSKKNFITIIGIDGIQRLPQCKIIPYPEQPRGISSWNKSIFILSNTGKVYKLSESTWEPIGISSPQSVLLKNFVITPTSTFIISGENTLKYYSSWIKSSHVKKAVIESGEIIAKLDSGIDIRLSDGKILKSTSTQTEDPKCIYLKEKYPYLAGCSPSYIAIRNDNIINIMSSSGTLVATVSISYSIQNISYFQGSSYITTRTGLYRMNLYKEKIILQINSKKVVVNGNEKVIDVAPIIKPPGRTFVPLRFISETLGATVIWNEDDRSIEIKLGDNFIKLWIGKKTLLVNGIKQNMDVAPFIDPSAGRTLVPIRFIAEYLGAFVYWIPRTKEVVIIQ